jgi:hypothetical protein
LSDGGFIEKRMSYRRFRRVSAQMEAESQTIDGVMPYRTYTQADVDAVAKAFTLDEDVVAFLASRAGGCDDTEAAA